MSRDCALLRGRWLTCGGCGKIYSNGIRVVCYGAGKAVWKVSCSWRRGALSSISILKSYQPILPDVSVFASHS